MTNSQSNLLPSILQFYGEHFARIDEGNIAGWAADFTHDADFISPTASLTTAEEIDRAASEAFESRASRGIRNRHYQSSVHIVSNSAESTDVTSYVLVAMLEDTKSQPQLLSTVVRDQLVYANRWMVRRREISFDGH